MKAQGCYHCGEPIPEGCGLGVLVSGEFRPVCCAGCEAVASAIVAGGFDAYYRMRTDGAAAQGIPEIDRATPAAPEGRSVSQNEFDRYDSAQVQSGLVVDSPSGREVSVLVEGVRCSACLWLVESVLVRMPGVVEAGVNYTSHRARVVWNPGITSLSAILREVDRFGYSAAPLRLLGPSGHERAGHRDLLLRMLVAGLGMMQVMMYAFPAYVSADGDLPADLDQLMRIAGLILTVPVVLYSGFPFFAGAWRNIANLRLGMDVPIAVGIAIAFVASVAAVLGSHGAVYFDCIAMFVFLILAGRYAELLARERAADVLAYLGRALPEMVSLLPGFPDRAEERVHVSALRPGDRVLVRAGESIPADGEVIDGSSAVEEAIVSGESEPIRKVIGSAVFAGSVNADQPLVVRVDRTGTDTLISTIGRLAERAGTDKPPLSAFAERMTGPFIAMVLGIALISGVWWWFHSPERVIPVVVSVLVATCPCAFALAIPVARVVALATLVTRGLVVTRGGAIESLSSATDVVLDKTGTLTHGQQRLVSVECFRGRTKEECIALAAALESAVSHPVARVLSAAAKGLDMPSAVGLRSVAGAGVEGEIEGVKYRLGSAGFAAGLSGKSSGIWEFDDRRAVLADSDGAIAVFGISDELRSDASDLVSGLKQLGMNVHLVSGDSEQRVVAVARQLGIQAVRHGAVPEEKQSYVRALQSRGRRVLMVGDGVNDAPVLAQADASIALGSGSVLAQVRADAVLLNSRLVDVVFAVSFSRRTTAIIRQNMAWAFVYNFSVLPLAMLGDVEPWAAAIGMSASSFLVIINALRLARRRPRSPGHGNAAGARIAA